MCSVIFRWTLSGRMALAILFAMPFADSFNVFIYRIEAFSSTSLVKASQTKGLSVSLQDVNQSMFSRKLFLSVDARYSNPKAPVSYTHLTLPTNREV